MAVSHARRSFRPGTLRLIRPSVDRADCTLPTRWENTARAGNQRMDAPIPEVDPGAGRWAVSRGAERGAEWGW